MADSLVKQVNEVEKPHFTILALHSGAGDGTVSDYENVASYLASNISGVDLILAAHDHLSSISYENGVYILNSGPYGAILNNAQIRVYVKDGKIVGKNVVPVAIHTADADPSQDFLNMFTEEIGEVDRFSNSPIAKQIGILIREKSSILRVHIPICSTLCSCSVLEQTYRLFHLQNLAIYSRKGLFPGMIFSNCTHLRIYFIR